MTIRATKVATGRAQPRPVVASNITKQSQIRAKKVCDFIEKYVIVPEGSLVGKPFKLLPEQRKFIFDVYGRVLENGLTRATRRGILSIARKNGKTGLIAALLLAHLVGPEARENSHTYSAARSREQASLVFNYAAKSIMMSQRLRALTKIAPSAKTIVGLTRNVNYRALSAEASTSFGLNPALVIHDELGQVIGPRDDLYDSLETAGGAQDEPLSLIISTQAATNADLLSLLIDDALNNLDPRTVCHLYAAPKDCKDIFDEKLWKAVNFAMGHFRSLEEFREAAERAKRLPSFEATFRNLYLNMRVSQENLFLSPLVWAQNEAEPLEEAFFKNPVHVGLDLSARTDLTSAVLAAEDESGMAHLKTLAFTPSQGLEERAKVDRAPYPMWVKQGHLIATPGRVIDYGFVAETMREKTEGMEVSSVAFDRWRIDLFKKEADAAGFALDAIWIPVGQGWKDMSPRLERFEQRLLECTIRHGSHPVLNMAANGAIAVQDPAGNRKLEKSKSSSRIDALVAAIMAVGAMDGIGQEEEEGEAIASSLFFTGTPS